ncbi:hypothetical protein QA089_000156 [Meyerozyma guilliermondii]
MFQRAKQKLAQTTGWERLNRGSVPATEDPTDSSPLLNAPDVPPTNSHQSLSVPESHNSTSTKSPSPDPFPQVSEPTITTHSDRFRARPAIISRQASHSSRTSRTSRKPSIPYTINGPINVNPGDQAYTSITDSVPPTTAESQLQRSFTEAEPDELQPLLNRSRGNSYSVQSVVVQPPETESWKSYFANYYSNFTLESHKGIVTTVMILLLLFLFFYLTYNQSDSLAVQAIEPSIHSISILKVHGDGVDFHVTGSLCVNYDNISNLFYRTFMKLGSLLLGSVIIIPQGPVRLTVDLVSDTNFEPLHVLNIFPPELQVDVLNKRITEIDFISKTDVIKENVVELANRALAVQNDSISFSCQGTVDSLVKTSLFQYETQNVRFNETVQLSKNDLEPEVVIENLKVAQNGNKFDVKSNITIQNNLPMNFALYPINWDILLDGCHEPYQVGSWTSQNISVKPNSPISVQIEGNVGEIAEQLLEPCENGLSSINELVKRYAAGQPIDVHLRASDENDNLPSWFLYIAHNVNYRFSFEPVLPQVKPPRISVKESTIEIPSAKDTLSAFMNANTSFEVDIPSGYDIEGKVSQLSTTYDLRKENDSIAQGKARHFLNWTYSENVVTVDADTEEDKLVILDPAYVGSLFSSYVNGHLAANLSLNTTFNDVHVDLPILSTVLDDITVAIPLTLSPDIEYLPTLKGWNVTIINIFLLDTTEDTVQVSIDFQVLNPTNYSLEIPKETIGCDVLFNDTVLGYAEVSDLYVPNQDGGFDYTAVAVLNVPSPMSRVNLELFVSEFVSGVKNLSLGFQGRKDKRSKNQGLQDLIGNIQVEDVELPSIGFDATNESPNPFLLESVIHVLTSEVELTLYNPVNNTELLVTILQAEASYDGTSLGHIEHHEMLMVPPGVYKTPRIKLDINQGVGMDILRRAIDGTLRVNVTAVFDTTIQQFSLQLLYHGQGLAAKVRL